MLLEDLNPSQRAAVLATEGPVLVVAGAGTGKTRVITYRVAHLIATGVPPSAILAVTFTNKAADQMKQRIARLLESSGKPAHEVWVSTFHSFCARLLRRDAPRLGLSRSFTIYDDDDQTAAVKAALQQATHKDEGLQPRLLRERISSAKNHGVTPEEMAATAFDPLGRITATVFALYQTTLQRAGALDFDDLLIKAVGVLRLSPEARSQWRARFQYLHVDEYQDSNAQQAELVRLLANEQRNVCVVGDEDQTIYSWRGARPANLQRFLDDFPEAQVISLEDNYRSTQIILDAAAALVSQNKGRLGKSLSAARGQGKILQFFEAQDALEEAEFVCARMAQILRDDSQARLAVLYRTTAQSRAFEEHLRTLGIRYRVVGGFSFYQRAEIKDVLAYLRLILNPADDLALLRILNVPPRGIGKVSIENLRAQALEAGASVWSIIESAAAPRTAALNSFRELISDLRRRSQEIGPVELLQATLDRSGYLEWVRDKDLLDRSARSENLSELLNAVAETIGRGEALESVLDQASLVSAADDYQDQVPVTLMTLHSAKGLEFDHVFLAGLEEKLFPHARALDSAAQIEEERRLCYVGMTRAKDSLTLTRARYRRVYGNQKLSDSVPSRFLAEIPGEFIESAAGSLAEAGDTRRYEADPEYAEKSMRRRHAAARSKARQGSSRLVGIRVRHATYGIGTIISIEGEEDDRKLTVSFTDYGTKKLRERYANLELL